MVDICGSVYDIRQMKELPVSTISVKMTVKVDGKKVTRRELSRIVVLAEDGAKLLHEAHRAVDSMAADVRNELA